MSILFDIGYLFVVILGSPWFLYKMLRTGKYRKGLAARLGRVTPREGDRRCLWVDGVSVGEVLAARTLVEAFSQRHPDWDVVISTTTSTGQEVAKKHYPGRQVFYYPMDFGFAVKRTMRAIRPDAVVLVEADLWPNFLGRAKRSGVPVVVVNNRITTRAWRQQMMVRYLSRVFLYERIAHIGVQTEQHAERLRAMGVREEQMTVTGSVKYDTAPKGAPDVEGLAKTLGIQKGQPVLVAGSTFAPEEKIILGIYGRLRARFPQLRLVLVPRHPQRFDEVAGLILESGLGLIRRSDRGKSGERIEGPGSVILGDTMGELTRMYGLADEVFVGKTLFEGGGQNIIDPAALGKAVVFGPSIFNFEEAAGRLLDAGGAVQVKDAEELERVLGDLIEHPEEARRMGEAARKAVDAGRGATARCGEVRDKVLAEKGLL